MAQSILIVDDEKEIVSMLYCYFSKLGYTVYTATAGNAALKDTLLHNHFTQLHFTVHLSFKI